MQDSVGNLLCYGHDGREPCGLKCQVGEAGGGTDNSSTVTRLSKSVTE